MIRVFPWISMSRSVNSLILKILIQTEKFFTNQQKITSHNPHPFKTRKLFKQPIIPKTSHVQRKTFNVKICGTIN